MAAGLNNTLRSATFPLAFVGIALCLLFTYWMVTPVHVSGPPTVLLPKADQRSRVDPGLGDLYVTVWPQGKCALQNLVVACADLSRHLSSIPDQASKRVLIRGDERVAYGDIRAVLESVERGGFGDAVLVTKQAVP